MVAEDNDAESVTGVAGAEGPGLRRAVMKETVVSCGRRGSTSASAVSSPGVLLALLPALMRGDASGVPASLLLVLLPLVLPLLSSASRGGLRTASCRGDGDARAGPVPAGDANGDGLPLSVPLRVCLFFFF